VAAVVELKIGLTDHLVAQEQQVKDQMAAVNQTVNKIPAVVAEAQAEQIIGS
jgi:hypothetical protein